MKRTKTLNKMAAFLAAVILTAVYMCQAVFAFPGAGINPSQPASLTVNLEAQNRRATIAVYRVGEWDGAQGAYVLTSQFLASGADIKDTTATGILEAAEILGKYAQEQGIESLAVQSTADGILKFTGLSNGLYLVYQIRGSSDNVTMSPFLTTLPVWNEETGSWNYDVVSLPKYEADPSGGGSSGGGGGGGGGATGRTSVTTTEEIADPDVPMTNHPIVDAIEDILVPLGILPKTGDNTVSIQIMLGVTVMSMALIVLLISKHSRKER